MNLTRKVRLVKLIYTYKKKRKKGKKNTSKFQDNIILYKKESRIG